MDAGLAKVCDKIVAAITLDASVRYPVLMEKVVVLEIRRRRESILMRVVLSMMVTIVGGWRRQLNGLQHSQTVVDLLMARLWDSVCQWLLWWLSCWCIDGLERTCGLEIIAKTVKTAISLCKRSSQKLINSPFSFVFIDHELTMVLLQRSLRVPKAEPRFGTLVVSVCPQKLQLVVCELCHRYWFNSVWWRQSASGKMKNRIVNKAKSKDMDCIWDVRLLTSFSLSNLLAAYKSSSWTKPRVQFFNIKRSEMENSMQREVYRSRSKARWMVRINWIKVAFMEPTKK